MNDQNSMNTAEILGALFAQASVVGAIVGVLRQKGILDLEDCREIHDISLSGVEAMLVVESRAEAISVARMLLEEQWAGLLGLGTAT